MTLYWLLRADNHWTFTGLPIKSEDRENEEFCWAWPKISGERLVCKHNKMQEKIKILILTANPTDTTRINIDQEVRDISDRLDEGFYRDEFELITYQALRPGDLQRLLMKHKPHIVHFTGHGTLVGKPTLVLEDDSGESKEVEVHHLVKLLNLFTHKPRLVVLNACNTELQAHAIAQVIEYAIGASAPIGNKAARTFSGAFYRALAFGRSILEAFLLAKLDIELHGLEKSGKYDLFVREDVDAEAGDSIIPSKVIGCSHGITQQQAGRRYPATHVMSTEEASPYLLTTREVKVTRAGHDVETNPDGVESPDGSCTSIEPVTSTFPYGRVHGLRSPQVTSPNPILPDPVFMGRGDSLVSVKCLLHSTHFAEQNFRLTIVQGSSGVGKTALVGAVARDSEIQKMFPDGILRTSLGQEPELMQTLVEWGRVLGADDQFNTLTLDAALVKFSHVICNRRILLIVDNVVNETDLLPLIKAAADSRCTLLAVTRVPRVAKALANDDKSVYVLPPLSMYHALTLLHYQVPAIVEQYPEESWQLVHILGCLPLPIVVAGRLLKAEASVGLNIGDVLSRIRQGEGLLPTRLNEADRNVLPAVHALLQRSTDALDELTRKCFASLGAFASTAATFDVQAMKAVWQVEDPTSIICKLVRRGLLEPIGDDRFHIHESLVRHARSLSTDLKQ